jgi:hypothetical protein
MHFPSWHLPSTVSVQRSVWSHCIQQQQYQEQKPSQAILHCVDILTGLVIALVAPFSLFAAGGFVGLGQGSTGEDDEEREVHRDAAHGCFSVVVRFVCGF